MLDKLLVVVVFYNPTRNQIENTDNIAKCLNVVVVDNSDNNLCGNYCFTYLPMGKNIGIASAQNRGIEYGLEHNYRYYLFFDQDSKIEKNYAYKILNEYLSVKDSDSHTGMIGPILIDEKTKAEYKNYYSEGLAHVKVSAVISSGSLIEADTIRSVGYFDEDLFIDYVDFEWCWRAVNKGYNIYITRNVALNHSIGINYRNFHGFIINISAPIRYFYQYRNTLILLRRGYVPFSWKIKSVIRKLLDFLIVPFFAQEKKTTIMYMLKGFYAGLH